MKVDWNFLSVDLPLKQPTQFVVRDWKVLSWNYRISRLWVTNYLSGFRLMF